MKVVVAMDSFKGSMTSMEVGDAVKEGILKVNKDIEVVVKPLADGGEGTAKALTEGLNGSFEEVLVTGPIGDKKVNATYGILKDKTAILEMAEAAGITLLKEEEKNPWNATTYGVGEMIKDAIQKGCRKFIIGIGGSATNDGGVGMLQALGFSFLDQNEKEINVGAKGLASIEKINTSKVSPLLKECTFLVACDVNNPLCGENGATFVYGPQKGVRESEKEEIDQAMKHYAEKTKEYIKKDNKNIAGAGAAGGMGFAFLSYLSATLKAGIDIVMEALELKEEIQNADYVITGEGCLDAQTAMGKAPIGVANLAVKTNAKVIALAGSIGKGANECNHKGITAFFSITPTIMTLEQAMQKEQAIQNTIQVSEQIFRLLSHVGDGSNV